ncbi:MAG: hypothetical protein NTW14_13065 [bacterium]|nr:hypothetical protein [bacterium]
MSDEEVAKTKQEIREKFDDNYPFPQKPYRYVFHFFDLIVALKINNAIFPFESFEEIKDTLKKQWAGLVYDSLDRDKHVPITVIEQFSKKLENIELQIRSLAESKTEESHGSRIASFDLKQLSSDLVRTDFQELKKRIEDILDNIIFDPFHDQRVIFSEEWDASKVKTWLESLVVLTKEFKWSTTISILELYRGLEESYRYWKSRSEIPYDYVRELCVIANNIEDSERDSFATTVALKLNKCFQPPPPMPVPPPPEPPELPDGIGEDVPF